MSKPEGPYTIEVLHFALGLTRGLEHALQEFEGLCDWLRYRNGVLDINAEFPPECLESIDRIFQNVSKRKVRAPVRRIQKFWTLRPCDLLSYFGNDALGSLHFVRQLATLASVSKVEDAKRLLQRYRCARREGRAVVRGSSRRSRWTATDVTQALAQCQEARASQQSALPVSLEDGGEPQGSARDVEGAVCEAVKLLEVSAGTAYTTDTPSSELLRQAPGLSQSASPGPTVDLHEVRDSRGTVRSPSVRYVVERRKERGFREATSKPVQSLRPGRWLHEDAILEVLQCVQTRAEEVYIVAPGFLTLGQLNNVREKKLRELNRQSHRLIIFPLNVDGNHWIIAFIDLEAHSISAYDPLHMRCNVRRACDILLAFVNQSPTFEAGPRSSEKILWSIEDYRVGHDQGKHRAPLRSTRLR